MSICIGNVRTITLNYNFNKNESILPRSLLCGVSILLYLIVNSIGILYIINLINILRYVYSVEQLGIFSIITSVKKKKFNKKTKKCLNLNLY